MKPALADRLLLGHAVMGLLLALPAFADEAAFCPERPGQTTPPCVMVPGQTMFESGIASWSRMTDAGTPSSQWIIGDLLLRQGLGHQTELQFGWQMLSRQSGSAWRSGDVTIGLLHNFAAMDGPVAAQVFATLPSGQEPAGAGDWGAGARLPIALEIGEDWSLGLTPEVDAAVNATGHGRHLALGGAIGLGRSLATNLSASADLSLFRDRDPDGSTTSAVTSISLAWQTGADTQLDLGLAAGLNRHSLERQAYVGFAHRFR